MGKTGLQKITNCGLDPLTHVYSVIRSVVILELVIQARGRLFCGALVPSYHILPHIFDEGVIGPKERLYRRSGLHIFSPPVLIESCLDLTTEHPDAHMTAYWVPAEVEPDFNGAPGLFRYPMDTLPLDPVGIWYYIYEICEKDIFSRCNLGVT